MFIKEAYQRRIQEQINGHSPTYLKIKSKSPAIGSYKTGRVNFDKGENFFTDNDVPQRSKTMKIETKQFKDPDILQLKKKEWNTSVLSPREFERFQDSQQDVLHKIKHGFYDYTHSAKQRPKQIQPGTDTRNNYQGWNVSTQFTKSQKQQNHHNLTVDSLQNSISFTKSKLLNYLKPTQRYHNQRLIQRQLSLNQSDLMCTYKEDRFRKHNANASPQKTNATIFKLLEQTRRQKLKETMFVSQDSLQITKRFKANLTNTQKTNISVIYVHNGSWSQVTWAQNGHAWSCCMNQQQNGRGCVKKVTDANKVNYASFNNQ